jgi:hypothetical protein
MSLTDATSTDTTPSSTAAGIFVVRLVHVAFVAWMVWAPFSNNDAMLVLHAMVCPFLFLHWATSSDGCALTIIEAKLRGVPLRESFVHGIVAPIYVIPDHAVRRTVFVATLGLWAVTLSKVDAAMFKRVLFPTATTTTK